MYLRIAAYITDHLFGFFHITDARDDTVFNCAATKYSYKGKMVMQLFIICLAMTGFWKTDHIVTREINRISIFMHL